MDFLSLAKKRYSCRRYKPDPVREEDLQKILEAGWVCPSAHNNQPYRLLVIRKPENLEKVRKAGKIYEAPIAIVVCGNTDEAWQNTFDGRKSTEIDAAIVTDHMMLEAADLGLDTLWICWFDHDIIKAELALPENLEPINILLIGYGEKEPKPCDRHSGARRPLDEIVVKL